MSEIRPPLFESGDTLSLYIHVPFCAQKCGYCDFYSRANVNGVELFLETIEKELELYFTHYPHLISKKIDTIFFGGGTPSILTAAQWQRISCTLTSRFSLSPSYEWTIECNPESFTVQKAEMWLASGVNRLSMGVQSLAPQVLKNAGRIHSAESVEKVLSQPILSRFKQVSCDVIYGLPGQSVADVKDTLSRLLSYDCVNHISAYELTIAEGTPFASLDETAFPDDEVLADYEDCVLSLLCDKGFERYEVSNYARPGSECRHNQVYWEMKPYLGLGPSAHSFDGVYRYASPSSLDLYSDRIKNGDFPWESCNKISTEMFRDEYLFLGLRTRNGISETIYHDLFDEELYSGRRIAVIEGLEKRGDLIREGGSVILTAKGMHLADGVALQLSR